MRVMMMMDEERVRQNITAEDADFLEDRVTITPDR